LVAGEVNKLAASLKTAQSEKKQTEDKHIQLQTSFNEREQQCAKLAVQVHCVCVGQKEGKRNLGAHLCLRLSRSRICMRVCSGPRRSKPKSSPRTFPSDNKKAPAHF
jgi:hypothetical protein